MALLSGSSEGVSRGCIKTRRGGVASMAQEPGVTKQRFPGDSSEKFLPLGT